MNGALDNLQHNFLFQASLGSKELFHSNLLAWILEQKSKVSSTNTEAFEALQIFGRNYLGIKNFPLIENREEIRIAREERNIDLILKWKDGDLFNYAFIENKLKSIPTAAQLEEYNEKIKDYEKGKAKLTINGNGIEIKRNESGYRYLLTPLKSDLNVDKWQKITYQKEIISFLEEIEKLDFVDKEKTNIILVINTYKQFIKGLISLLETFYLDDDNTEKFKARPYDFYSGENEDMKEVHKLRLHDLILKLAHQKISNLIKEELSKDYKDAIATNFEDYKKRANKGVTAILISHAFTRSTGISGISVSIKGLQSIGLQLQENSLKYVAENFDSKKGKENKDYAFQLFNDKLWFYDGENPLTGKGRNKDLKIQGKDITFNSYGNNFIYLNKSVSDNSINSIKELVDLMCSETRRVLNNKEKYLPR